MRDRHFTASGSSHERSPETTVHPGDGRHEDLFSIALRMRVVSSHLELKKIVY